MKKIFVSAASILLCILLLCACNAKQTSNSSAKYINASSFFRKRRFLFCLYAQSFEGLNPTIANPGCFWVQPGFIVYLYQFASEGGVPSGNHVIPCAWKARCTMPRLFAPRFREMHHGFPKMHHDFARCTRLPSKMHHENGKCTKLFLKCTRVNGKMHPAFLILSK